MFLLSHRKNALGSQEDEFESAMVNEPSVFESLKFYCKIVMYIKCLISFFVCSGNIGFGGSVGCASDWWSGGCGFDPRRVDNILSWKFDHDFFYGHILYVPLIQEGHLSVFGERMCTTLFFFFFFLSVLEISVSVAQLDARPTDDQEVAGSTPAGSITFFRWHLIMKYFSTVILSLPLIQKGQLSVFGERMCTTLVNHLED